jgi:hypothetical protein
MRKDIEHFADAIRDRGFDPSEVRARGLGGADAFVDLANKLASVRTPYEPFVAYGRSKTVTSR